MPPALVCIPGAEVDLLVLAAGRRVCAAVDLSSGALVQAYWQEPAEPFAPMAVVRARVAESEGDIDPVRPEAVALAGAPSPMGNMSRRRAERLLRPLMHPTDEHLLGFPGPSIPYWDLAGDRPSVAVVSPPSRIVVTGDRCRFWWRRLQHELPLLPAARSWAPAWPRRLVLTLSAPRQGRCYKVVAGLLPG